MEAKIMSTEMIKPASPTPPHLRYFNLSFLDQLSPHMFVPFILYYPHHQMGKAATTADISRRLKSSLSQSLVQFYPLAGRFEAKANQIECNDQGVEFYETRVVNCLLEELLKQPNLINFAELVPCYHNCTKYTGREDVLLAVQANFFECGGLALGVSLSHFAGDASTIATFLKGWASTAGSERETPHKAPERETPRKAPLIANHHLFPQILGVPRLVYSFAINPTMKRFVIDESNLAALRRSRAGAPTRMEAITALVCRCMARGTRKNVDSKDERGFIIFNAVNVRRRMEPPLPNDAFGNFWIMAVASPEGSPADDKDGGLEVISILDLGRKSFI